MEAIEAILTRRSVRHYNGKPISEEIIKKLIIAAMSAPSAGNQQPWHFIIIDDKTIFEKIPKFHENAKFITDAQKAILVCGDLDLEINKGYWMIDCSVATQNILLAARAYGLSSCWLGIYPRNKRIKKLKDILEIPTNVIPFSLISLGYTNIDQKKIERFNNSRVHKNKW
jgi:nitroreductase